jgi:hypothetical protein
LVNLGIHLQWQNDPSAFALIPTLEWLNERRELGGIGQGLLARLIENRRNGVGPNHEPKRQQNGLEVSPSPERD